MTLDRVGRLHLLTWLLLAPWPALAWAEEPPTLSDRHRSVGISCGACHGETPPDREPPAAGCAACHGNLVAIAARTRAIMPNPHLSHKGEVECRMCHHAHCPFTDWCAQCHPAGYPERR